MLKMESMYFPFMNPSSDSNMASMMLISVFRIQGDALVPVEIAVIVGIFIRILGHEDFQVVWVKLAYQVAQDIHQVGISDWRSCRQEWEREIGGF